ncbi:MAG: hypothetical protein ACKOXJ_03785, partial [Alphaproteobacteria bacterium]
HGQDQLRCGRRPGSRLYLCFCVFTFIGIGGGFQGTGFGFFAFRGGRDFVLFGAIDTLDSTDKPRF